MPAPQSGTIVELLVEDGAKVTAKQKLYKLQPGAGGAAAAPAAPKAEAPKPAAAAAPAAAAVKPPPPPPKPAASVRFRVERDGY